jgi:hypothetical protein
VGPSPSELSAIAIDPGCLEGIEEYKLMKVMSNDKMQNLQYTKV